MEACTSVEKEVDKVLNKFVSIRDHGSRTVEDLITYLSNLKQELEQGDFLIVGFAFFVFCGLLFLLVFFVCLIQHRPGWR